jgi:predicted nucleic acid-binding protein
MFDTNIFDHIIKNEIDVSSLSNKIEVYATELQHRELKAAPDPFSRLVLFSNLTKTVPTESGVIGTSAIGTAKIAGNVVPTESAVFDLSAWGTAKWGDENSPSYQEILEKLNIVRKHKNNPKDALIAQTAIRNGYVLFTDDKPLYKVVSNDFQSPVANLDDLRKIIGDASLPIK